MPADRPTIITPYRDGPLLVRGDVTILDEDGTPIDPGRATIALCRCGRSQLKPLCDGTHHLCAFSAPSRPPEPRTPPESAATTTPRATRP